MDSGFFMFFYGGCVMAGNVGYFRLFPDEMGRGMYGDAKFVVGGGIEWDSGQMAYFDEDIVGVEFIEFGDSSVGLGLDDDVVFVLDFSREYGRDVGKKSVVGSMDWRDFDILVKAVKRGGGKVKLNDMRKSRR